MIAWSNIKAFKHSWLNLVEVLPFQSESCSACSTTPLSTLSHLFSQPFLVFLAFSLFFAFSSLHTESLPQTLPDSCKCSTLFHYFQLTVLNTDQPQNNFLVIAIWNLALIGPVGNLTWIGPIEKRLTQPFSTVEHVHRCIDNEAHYIEGSLLLLLVDSNSKWSFSSNIDFKYELKYQLEY